MIKSKKVSEYDQVIPESHTAVQSTVPLALTVTRHKVQ